MLLCATSRIVLHCALRVKNSISIAFIYLHVSNLVETSFSDARFPIHCPSVARTQKRRETLPMRIGILTSEQTSDCEPHHFVSKVTAGHFCDYFHNGRRAVQRISKYTLWIRVNLTFAKLKALIRDFRDHAAPALSVKRYIPTKMPPREVPNCFFEEPKSVTWRLAHRMVILPESS